MEDPNASPASDNKEPNAEQRIAELEAQLDSVTKRYSASSAEAQRLAQTVQQLQQPPRQNVPSRRPWEETLENSGVPAEAIRNAIHEEAMGLIQQQFEPMTRAVQARQTMVGRYKDYGKFESDMMGFVNSDPELQQTYTRIFSADPVAAFDYAYLKFGMDQRGKRSKNGGMDNDIVETQIPTNRSGDTRRAPRGADAAVEEAARAYRDKPSTRTAEAYGKARLKTVISDEFLNS
jgi:hypothetical protein